MGSAIIMFSLLYVICTLFLIKNNINRTIQLKWIDEAFSQDNWEELSSQISDYNTSLFDLTLWKHIPLQDYLERKGD